MNLFTHIACGLIRAYQVVFPPVWRFLFGPGAVCRFEPSCSHYGRQAIREHGVLKGSFLAVGRICRCHPWGGYGLDPVPPARHSSVHP